MDSLQRRLNIVRVRSFLSELFELNFSKNAFVGPYTMKGKSIWDDILWNHTYGQSTGRIKNDLVVIIFH